MLEVNAYIIDLESTYTAIRQEADRLKTEILELKAQIAKHDRWEQEKEKYEVVQDSSFITVYRLKNTKQVFCPVCFHQKSMAIPLVGGRHYGELSCAICKANMRFDYGALGNSIR